MKKKSIIKELFLLILYGLLVSIFLYPLLHELGHILAAIIAGGQIKEITLFPLPSVLCDLAGLTPTKTVIIGLSSGMLPIVVSLVHIPKRFNLWYMNFLLKLICVYNIILDTVYMTLYFIGVPVPDNDITTILSLRNNNLVYLIFIFINTVNLVLLCASLKKSSPVNTILSDMNIS